MKQQILRGRAAGLCLALAAGLAHASDADGVKIGVLTDMAGVTADATGKGSVEAARLAKDRLGAYLVLGVLSSFTFQVIYNITMSAGLAPVKGLTLPLMSYGGSSLIATLAGFGLILNVRMRRFTN